MRWKSVETLAASATKASALEIVRIFFEKPLLSPDFDSTYQNAFKKNDNAFPMRNNGLELQVLAMATIAQILETAPNEISDIAALAVVCSNFQGLRQRNAFAEMIDTCESYLRERSDDLRNSFKAPALKKLGKTKDLADSATAALTIPAGTFAFATIQPIIEKLELNPNRLVDPINEALALISTAVQQHQEESNILWWVFSAYSHDLKKPFSRVAPSAAGLVAGKELADLVQQLPGPLAFEAFLHKLIESMGESLEEKKYSIKSAINSADLTTWKKESTASIDIAGIKDFCATHQALKQSTSSEAGDQWFESFAVTTGFTADTELPLLSLAKQSYIERLLIAAAS